MTTSDLAAGRPAATLRPRSGLTLFLLLTAACVASPAFAATGLAGDSADQLRHSGALSDAVAAPVAAVPEPRIELFAADVSKLIAAKGEPSLIPADTSGRVQSLLKRAMALLGTPYRWGGTSPDGGFDCSGLVGYVFRTALGIELPRVSRDMASKADAELVAAREELRQGDLVFFGLKGRVNHVGIYVGEGRFLHSPSRGKDVRVDSLLTGYWANRYLSGRRVAM